MRRAEPPERERRDEAAQVASLAGLVVAREALELADVGDPPLGSVQRGEVQVVAVLRDRARNDLAEGAVGRRAPRLREALGEGGAAGIRR